MNRWFMRARGRRFVVALPGGNFEGRGVENGTVLARRRGVREAILRLLFCIYHRMSTDSLASGHESYLPSATTRDYCPLAKPFADVQPYHRPTNGTKVLPWGESG